MGIDITGLDAILFSQQFCETKKNMLMIGRQGIHLYGKHILDNISRKYNINCPDYVFTTWSEPLFNFLGHSRVDSLDYSAFEGANIIHNMNKPITNETLLNNEPILNKYNYILDCGTTEHIFNCPQVCENIINLLDIGGIYLSVIPNNNLSGHGIYQFSPEFFMTAYSEKYGMKVMDLYIAEVNAEKDRWIQCNSYNGWRNMAKFNNTNEVYIIAIVKKISNTRESLIDNPPNQYSYEKDWISF